MMHILSCEGHRTPLKRNLNCLKMLTENCRLWRCWWNHKMAWVVVKFTATFWMTFTPMTMLLLRKIILQPILLVHAWLAPLTEFSFHPKIHLAACSQANSHHDHPSSRCFQGWHNSCSGLWPLIWTLVVCGFLKCWHCLHYKLVKTHQKL